MPQYVYALHDFAPEHEDEVDFKAGERIEVLDRDDLYGDGWWQGKNLAGKIGLFPQSYTTPAPPTTNGPSEQVPEASSSTPKNAPPTTSVLPALEEESESESPTDNPHIISPVPRPPPAIFLNGNDSDLGEQQLHEEPKTAGGDGEMMKATLTDVQKAIEQLGRDRNDDGSRSFSFASTRDGETDTDFELSDIDGDNDEQQGEGWHKNARAKLAENARQAVADAQRLEAMMSERSTAPPIDVELSDESEDEDSTDYSGRGPNWPRTHPHIPEEDEEDAKGHTPEPSATTTVTPKPPAEPIPVQEEPTTVERVLSSPPPVAAHISLPPPPEQHTTPTPAEHNTIPTVITPPPTVVSPPLETATSVSSTTDTSVQALSPPPTTKAKDPSEWTLEEVVDWLRGKGFGDDVCEKFIEQEITGDVLLELDVNLLKTEIGIMAFGKRMRIANAITDLRRPPSVTSSAEPYAPSLDGHRGHTPPSALHVAVPSGMYHVRSLSHSHSVHSYPGTPLYNHSIHSQSQGQPSPVVWATPSQGFIGQSPVSAPSEAPAQRQSGHVSMGSVASGAAVAAAIGGAPVGLGIDGMGAPAEEPPAVVPGDVFRPESPKPSRGWPGHLTLSPSDGNLKSKILLETATIRSVRSQEEREDRAHMSDGEVGTNSTSVRRRLFGRSHDSSLSVSNTSSRTSRDGASGSPSGAGAASQFGAIVENDNETVSSKDSKDKGKEKEKDGGGTVGSRHKARRSVDRGERLSIFGATFGGSLSKGRKPPPSDDGLAESKSSSMFSRLGHGSTRKPSGHRDRTSGSRSPKPMEERDRARNVSGISTMSAMELLTRKPSSEFRASGSKRMSADKEKEKDGRATLRKRTMSNPASPSNGVFSGNGNGHGKAEAVDVPGDVPGADDSTGTVKQGASILEQVGEPDHVGWMRKKGVRYNSWKLRYCVLKGEHLYVLRSNDKKETRLKGYVNIHGYKVTVDENLGPGRYGFRIDHDHDKTHYFSSDEKTVIREWMKAIMKATIGRDYTRPVVSSCNIPTIPLIVAQAMNPAPRPPSPGARDATQKALRRENPHQLSSRDARVLMGLPGSAGQPASPTRTSQKSGSSSFFADDAFSNGQPSGGDPTTPKASTVAPPRPSREMRRMDSVRSTATTQDGSLIDWGNSHLPDSLQVYESTGSLFSGLALMRIAESVRGKPASPPVPDSAFPSGPSDDKLDGLFRLFDFLLDNDVKMGSVSINDVRQGKRDKIMQLLKALKAWEEKRKALSLGVSSGTGAAFMSSVGLQYAAGY